MDTRTHNQHTRALPGLDREQPTMPLPVRRPPLSLTPQPPRRRRWPKVVLALLALLLALGLVVGGSALYVEDRVLPGVQVADLDLGGLSSDEAATRLAARLAGYGATTLVLEYGDRHWPITPHDLGVEYDVRAIMREVMRPGQSWPLQEQVTRWLPTERYSHTVQVTGTVDQTRLLAALQPVLAELNAPASDASMAIKPDAGLLINPSRPGQEVDVAAVALAVQDRALRVSTEPVPLVVRPVPPAITEQAFAPLQTAADALLRQPFTLELAPDDAAKLGNPPARSWAISPRELTHMLILAGADQPALALEESRLTGHLAGIAGQLARRSKPAELSLNNEGVPVLTPHEYGVRVDVPATAQAVNAAIAAGQYRVTLRTQLETPAVLTAELEPVHAELERALNRTLTLTAQEATRTLGRRDLVRFLILEPRPEATPKAAVQPDRKALNDYLTEFSRQFNREARPPVFKYVDGQVTRTSEGVDGRTLRTEEAVAELAKALLVPTVTTLPLPVAVVEAPLRNVDPNDIVIRDVLGRGTTAYGFSLPERKNNVELATQRLNGTLIPPGEWFSFNRAVGSVSTATGYQLGYGIVLTNGAVQTVPSVGGGICQVATTVFHAAFHAGMPIGERNWHLYWMGTYGRPPSGMTGLDATVDEEAGLDFTFRNTTGGWVALETSYDGQNITMVLKGVNPGWQVQVDGPHISNIRPTDPTPIMRNDPTLPRGRRVQVESAGNGMDVVINRTVLKDGQAVDQRSFRSQYEPSHNVTLVGTGG